MMPPRGDDDVFFGYDSGAEDDAEAATNLHSGPSVEVRYVCRSRPGSGLRRPQSADATARRIWSGGSRPASACRSPSPGVQVGSFHVHNFDRLRSFAASSPSSLASVWQWAPAPEPELAAAVAATERPCPWHEGAPAPAPPALRPLSARLGRQRSSRLALRQRVASRERKPLRQRAISGERKPQAEAQWPAEGRSR
mmetsp:Transcript_81558/g.174788  ORF Transcript_81558/g.174788 Transcript_81558/m.174788 type:complete len:196 (+) Transcript_81558:86-673(+)